MNIHTAIVNTKDKKILKENATKFISADSNGAETVFVGRVRNENEQFVPRHMNVTGG